MRAGLLATAAALACLAGPARAASVFSSPPPDPRAVTVRGGGADASAAIQAALDQARGAQGQGGIVFLPSGGYRISRTLYIWPAVRLIGVGPTRPTLVLGERTPGFGDGVRAMVVFAGAAPDARRRPPFPVQNSVPVDPRIADANPGTFYSAISNIDVEIGAGNAGAVGVRFHAAQHALLSHMDFRTGSGLAGLYQVANEAEDLHFHGGRYGILAEKPSPAWQFTLLDSSFDGQREAAIREHEAGLTLSHDRFADTPVAVEIDKGYGDWLWGEHLAFERHCQVKCTSW